jgi:hypothetical protein
MTVDIHFAGGTAIRTAVSYEAEGLASALSGETNHNQRNGMFLVVRTLDDRQVLVNSATVAYLANVD